MQTRYYIFLTNYHRRNEWCYMLSFLRTRNQRCLVPIGPLKALGSDGFLACFFQRNWNIMKSDIVMAGLKFFNDGHMLHNRKRSELERWFLRAIVVVGGTTRWWGNCREPPAANCGYGPFWGSFLQLLLVELAGKDKSAPQTRLILPLARKPRSPFLPSDEKLGERSFPSLCASWLSTSP